jgi:hypothetical protein
MMKSIKILQIWWKKGNNSKMGRSDLHLKCHVSYCHHLASVVVRCKLFQKSSPLKVLDQWKPNLVWITRVSSFKIVSGDAVHQPTWPLLLKIEHRVSRSWHAAHFCNLNLTFISYSFWNIRWKVLKFYKFDEKTPRWVIRFTSKLQGRAAVTKNRTYGKISGFW